MRLDKFISQAAKVTRSQAKKLITSQRVTIDGQPLINPSLKIFQESKVRLDEKPVKRPEKRYILLHKPAGFICSTIDEEYPSALKLLDIDDCSKLHFAGRLDQDTTGLVLISDDGDWTHRVTSPKNKCSKTYRVWLAEPLDDKAKTVLEEGVLLKSESKPTKPAQLQVLAEKEVLLTIVEGKYHQVKRMFAAVGNRVVSLHRESIGELSLNDLEESGWRHLNSAEIAKF